MRYLWARPAYILLDEQGREVGTVLRTDRRVPIVRLDLDPEPMADGGGHGRPLGRLAIRPLGGDE